MFAFWDFTVLDVIDIFCVALLMFYVYNKMRKSRALNIFIGIIIFILIWILVSHVLQMPLMGSLLDKLTSVGLIAIIVIFQDEIRHFFYTLGASQNGLKKFLHNSHQKSSDKKRKDNIMALVIACRNMSRSKTGALIVLERNVHLDEFINSGEKFNAEINQRLIENIFFKNSPLHDGALIISDQRIKAASCILPVSHNTNIPENFGLRHRSALGISEISDAIVIVVSEETGFITVAMEDKFIIKLTDEELESLLDKELI